MAKPQPYPFKAFRGEIGIDGQWWPIRYQVATGNDGELRFRVTPMAYTKETVGLRQAWELRNETVPFFKLRGQSASGVTFSSDHITVSTLGLRTTPTRTTLTPKLKCSKGAFTRQAEGATNLVFVRLLLRNFEGLVVETHCSLGRVMMRGPLNSRSRQIVGVLEVSTREPVADIGEWRARAEALGLHLQRYMSFAQSRLIRAPIQEFWDGATLETTHWSQTKGCQFAQPVIHSMKLKAYFEHAVAAFFDPPITVVNPTYALEWFAMDASHTEQRLMNAMTALENMADSNLPTEAATFLPNARFQKIAKAMRRAAAAFSSEQPAPDDDVRAREAAFLEGLSAKMLDLNRRALGDKIKALAALWGVPIADLIENDDLTRAIKARNAIVHRGWYYKPGAATPEQRDLWDHVLLMREFTIRFVLTTLQYHGDYLSFRGGQHEVRFEPLPRVTRDGVFEPAPEPKI